MICTAKNREGNPCEMSALKGEELCLFHSDSERVKEIRKRPRKKGTERGRYDKHGNLTLRGFWLDLKWSRKQLMADEKTTALQKASVLKMLDVRILKLQEMMAKSKPRKPKRLLTGTQLIQRESSGEITRKKVVTP